MASRRTRSGVSASDFPSVPKTPPGAQSASSEAPSAASRPGYWRETVAWYPDGIFGPYRPPSTGYSRRELLADGVVHVAGVALGFVGVGALLATQAAKRPPAEVVGALLVYCASLLAMLLCSATFNGLAWSKPHLWALQLADHTGILLLIAGTYCPIMAMACCPRVMGALTPWAQSMCLAGGLLYTVGLVPWAVNRLEYHNAVWHVFVLAASGCFFAVQLLEVAQPDRWGAGARPAAGSKGGACLLP